MPKPIILRRAAALALFAFSIALIAGCQGERSGPSETFDPDQPVKLKVMSRNSDYFYQRYGNMLIGQFPNVEFEVIEQPSGSIEEQKVAISKSQPDVLLLSSPLYEALAEDGALMDLEPAIERDKFDLNGISPSVTELLREGGSGKLYGLAPEFSTSVLYYNKDLFNQYGVELPRDRMSWDDVLKLAQRFPSEGTEEERNYGFEPESAQGLFDLILDAGTAIGLTPISVDGSNIVIASDSWKKIFASVMQAYQSNVLHFPSGDIVEQFRNDLFTKGRVAIKENEFFYYSTIVDKQRTEPNSKPLNFDVATVPVDPANPDVTNALSLNSIFAVSNHSAQKPAAWEVVKYINSEDLAKVESKTMNGQIPVRKDYVPNKEIFNIEPFFALKPAAKRSSDSAATPEFKQAFKELASNELHLVADNAKSLDEAIETIQTKGQQLLDSFRLKADP